MQQFLPSIGSAWRELHVDVSEVADDVEESQRGGCINAKEEEEVI